jgi:septal ring factor EnvC (AmiA/AmiB activator)
VKWIRRKQTAKRKFLTVYFLFNFSSHDHYEMAEENVSERIQQLRKEIESLKDQIKKIRSEKHDTDCT